VGNESKYCEEGSLLGLLRWAFYDELKAAVGKYPPVWRCVGCHPAAEAALALYEQKKEFKAMPKGLVGYG